MIGRGWAALTLLAVVTAVLGVASPARAQGPTVVDGFTRADAPELGTSESGHGWTAAVGAWAVAAEQARQSSAGYGLALIDAGTAHGTVRTVVSETSAEFWVVVRASDGHNYWRFGRSGGGSYQLQQIRGNLIASVPITLETARTPQAGDVVSCTTSAAQLVCAVDDVVVARSDDAFNAGATQLGLAAYDPSAAPGVRFDDVSFTPPPPAPALSVTVADSADPVGVDDALVYTVTVRNDGAADAHDVTVHAPLPASVVVAPGSSSAGCDETASAVTCAIGTVPAQGEGVATLAVRAEAPGDVTMAVTVTASEVPEIVVTEATTVRLPLVDGEVWDGFSRADAPTLGVADSGQAWSELVGRWGVAGGRATATAGGYAVAVLDAPAATGTALATVPVISSEFWLVVRASDGANYWRFGRTGGGAYQLQQIRGNAIAAVPVTLEATVTPAAGDVLSCASSAARLTCSVNGAVVARSDDGFGASATGFGLAAWDPSGAPAVRFDDVGFVPPEPVPVLTVTVDDGVGPVVVGADVSYTATVRNDGAAAATGVTVATTVPAGATLVSATASQGTCAPAAGAVACTLGELAAGATATATVTVNAGQTGTLTTTATASADGVEGVSATEETEVIAEPVEIDGDVVDTFSRADAPALGNAETGQPWQALIGGWGVTDGRAAQHTPGYGLAVLDAGGEPAAFRAAVPVLSHEFWLVVRASDAQNYWRFGRAGGTYRLEQIRGNLIASTAVTVEASVSPTAGDVLACTTSSAGIACSVDDVVVARSSDAFNATATGFGFAAYDGSAVPGVRFDDVALETLAAHPFLSVALDDVLDPVVAGDEVEYVVDVRNDGTAPADAVALEFVSAGGGGIALATASQGSCAIPEGAAVTCTLGTVAPQSQARVTIHVAAPATGTVTASATVTAADLDTQVRSESTTVSAEPPVVEGDVADTFNRPDSTSLGLTDTGHAWHALLGQWGVEDGRAKLTSDGYGMAIFHAAEPFGVLRMKVPVVGDEFWVLLHATDSGNYFRFGRSNGGPYRMEKVEGNRIGSSPIHTYNLVTPADGDEIACWLLADDSLDCYVNGVWVVGTGDLFNLTATGFGFSAYPQGGAGGVRFDDVTFTGFEDGGPAKVPAPDLAVAATATPPAVSVAEPIDYAVTVTNTGQATATGVVVEATLPAGAAVVSSDVSQGECTIAGTTLHCTVGHVLPSAAVTIDVRVTVATPGTATAHVVAHQNEPDRTPANNGVTLATQVD